MFVVLNHKLQVSPVQRRAVYFPETAQSQIRYEQTPLVGEEIEIVARILVNTPDQFLVDETRRKFIRNVPFERGFYQQQFAICANPSTMFGVEINPIDVLLGQP